MHYLEYRKVFITKIWRKTHDIIEQNHRYRMCIYWRCSSSRGKRTKELLLYSAKRIKLTSLCDALRVLFPRFPHIGIRTLDCSRASASNLFVALARFRTTGRTQAAASRRCIISSSTSINRSGWYFMTECYTCVCVIELQAYCANRRNAALPRGRTS